MKKRIDNFLKSTTGNFAIILALAITPSLLTVGAAVDYSGFKRMENRMQLSAEAAMLAASKEVVRIREQDYAEDGDYDMTNAEIVEELDKVFKPFFEANFAAGGYDLSEDQYTLEYIEADNNTKVRITMDYDTAVMRAFGRDTLTATKDMIINLKIQPRNYVIDIVMCIDATGSMQDTLDAVQANAMTFNADLREELGIGVSSEKVKIRVRPIFYRDWEEGRDYQNAYAQYEQDYADWEDASTGGGFDFDAFREDMEDEWDDSDWWYENWRGRWNRSNRYWEPRTHKRVRVNGDTEWLYFRSKEELNDWIDDIEDGDIVVAGIEPNVTPGDPPTPPINHGLNIYGDFIDLDPNPSEAEDRQDRNTAMTDFLGSTYAFGGHDWPEAASSCMNEAVRSNWYDNQSDHAREYFKVPTGDVIIKENDEVPTVAYTKITPIPVIVFWSDATINSRFDLGKQYLSPTQPTTYSGLQDLWNDTSKFDTRYRMLIRFGPSDASGWNTVKDWDRVYYGGSLSTGNDDAVKVIAEKILDAVPDMLRVGS